MTQINKRKILVFKYFLKAAQPVRLAGGSGAAQPAGGLPIETVAARTLRSNQQATHHPSGRIARRLSLSR
jgi:hypothetical protein